MKQRGVPSLIAREVHAHPAQFTQVLPLAFRRAPLLYAGFALAAGMLLTHVGWRPAALLTLGTALLLAVAACALTASRRLALPSVLLAWLLLGWTLATLRPAQVADDALLPFADGMRREAAATVLDMRPLPLPKSEQEQDPQHWSEQAQDRDGVAEQHRYSVDLQLSMMEDFNPDTTHMLPVRGGARVTMDADLAGRLACGATLRGVVRLYRPRSFRDPGVWSYAGWLATKNLSATGQLLPLGMHAEAPHSVPLACRFSQMRAWGSSRLQRFSQWQQRSHLPAVMRWHPEDTAALQAMLFGDRTDLTHTLRSAFERTGTFHLFVVAGLHVGIVAAGMLWLLQRAGLPGWLTLVATALTTTSYAMLVGFAPPVQRALWMTLVYLCAQALARDRNVLNAIGAAVLAILVPAPQQLFESSFQMTVLIALTIGGIAVPLLDRTTAPYARAARRLDLLRLDATLPPHLAEFRVLLRWAKSETTLRYGAWGGALPVLVVRAALALLNVTLVCLITELVMSLPMAFYFHRITLTALPANLLVIPLLAPTMLCAIAAFLLCTVSFPLAAAASVPAALLLHLTMTLVRRIGEFSASDSRTPGPALTTAVMASVLIVAAVLLVRVPSKPLGWLGAACSAMVMGAALLLPRTAVPRPALQVDAMDVGQGDALLITGPGGKTMLMDAGGTVGTEQEVQRATFDTGEQVVSPYLWQRGVRTLDVLALSHAHLDHLGGMDAVLRNFRPRELWLSVDADSALLRTLLADAARQGVRVRHMRAGEHFLWDGTDVRVLSPAPQYRPGSAPANDDSLVLHLQYEQASALLAGDAEQPSEDAMLAAHVLAPVTLLKVGHHGSLTSTSEAWLNALQPRAAVISCGRGNRFGHPRMPILERLQQHHVLTSRTDTMGATEYTLLPDGTLRTSIPPTVP